MAIRRLTLRDCELAQPLIEAQYREHGIAMGGPRLAGALRTLVRGKGLVLLSTERVTPVGTAVLSWNYELERGGAVAWLDELYVVPERRGKGIGRALLRHALREARREGCESVQLEVVRGHDRAARLYVREGFARLPRTRYMRVL
ncbi:MAG TPA: GNAT family N-acetyltransferase [Myxococcales bacterium]|jgi:GNAT superfamily N-acetyltransferase|nr:GNAT family N-acetyltransferase [Myxococcales bacterium]